MGIPFTAAWKGSSPMARTHTTSTASLASVLALLLLGVLPVRAQDVTYTTVSRAEFGGALGTMMRMVPGAQDPSRETTHIKGSFMRTDDEDSSTILDMAAGRFTELDHKAKTFFSFTFADMAAQVQAAGAEMKAAQAERPADEPQPEVEFETKLTVDRTGKTQRMNGYTAEQVLMIIEIIPKVAPEEGAEKEAAGTMVLFSDLWMSKDFPGYEAYKKATEELARSAGASADVAGMGDALQQAFASDPRMKEAFEKSAEEMKGMEGLAVRTVTSFFMVPTGVPFDREAALASAGQPLAQGPDLGGAAAAGAREAARSAVSNITGGLLGRRRQQPQPQEEAAPPARQAAITRITATIEDVKTGSLSDDLFRAPPDYKEVKPDWMKGGSD
jgi:hypothetical protein